MRWRWGGKTKTSMSSMMISESRGTEDPAPALNACCARSAMGRLARTNREWHTLLEFCSIVGALLIDAETVYDPKLTNDRLLLGMKGTIAEMEVATFRERAQAALLQKAK